jgi:hypothetical protein
MSMCTNGDGRESAVQNSTAISGDEALVERIWQEAQGSISRDQIRQLLTEAKKDFADATVTLYIPILVYRQVKEKLAIVLDDAKTTDVRRSVDPTPLEQVGDPSDCTTATSFKSQASASWLFGLFGRRGIRQRAR